MFITFEGGEGSGKTTIIKRLQQYFIDQNRKVVVTREPGGGKISEDIRRIILNKNNKNLDKKAEALLFAAARVQHLNDVILPSLEKGYVVICDRFIDSSFVYQGGANNLGASYISKINDFIDKKSTPDITFLFDIDPEVGLKRVKGRGKELNRLDLETQEYHQNVRSNYLELAKKYKNRIIVINSDQPEDSTFLEVIDNLSKHKEYKKYEKSREVF